jgi:hypothetical protein
MTLFEYLSVAVSILLSLGLVRLVTGFRAASESDAKYWIHVFWIAILVGLCLAHWWTSWSFRDAQWTFITFVLMLSGPAILYFIAMVLVPDDANSVEDWKEYFFKKRVQFYSSLAVYMAFTAIDGYLILGAPLLAPARAGQVAGFMLAIVGLAVKKPAPHAVITWLFALLFVVAAFTLIATPDAITGAR